MKTVTITQAKKKAWKYFSQFIRLRDALETTGNKAQVFCFTCGKPYPAFGKGCVQAGHFIPGRKNSVLFVEEIVHGQCYNCNVNLKGNWVEYERIMVEKYGKERVEEWKKLNRVVVKYTPNELLEKAEYYKNKVTEMGGVD